MLDIRHEPFDTWWGPITPTHNPDDDLFDAPLGWDEPTTARVEGLFSPEVEGADPPPFELIAAVFGVMAACPDHTFQVLTKRPERMREFFQWVSQPELASTVSGDGAPVAWCFLKAALQSPKVTEGVAEDVPWPLPNVWIGVSCEDQDAAYERIPPLLECPAAVRFVSAEPLLGPINFTVVVTRKGHAVDALRPHEPVHSHTPIIPALDWVIVGGESGPEARPCKLEWIDGIIEQCHEAGVPAFVKQLGAEPLVQTRDAMHPAHPPYTEFYLDHSKGADPSEWPEGLRVREFPEGVSS